MFLVKKNETGQIIETYFLLNDSSVLRQIRSEQFKSKVKVVGYWTFNESIYVIKKEENEAFYTLDSLMGITIMRPCSFKVTEEDSIEFVDQFLGHRDYNLFYSAYKLDSGALAKKALESIKFNAAFAVFGGTDVMIQLPDSRVSKRAYPDFFKLLDKE